MKKSIIVSTSAIIFCILTFIGAGADSPGKASMGQIKAGPLKADLNFGKMPLYFIPNEGQKDRAVDFYVQGRDKSLYFSPQGLTFVLTEPVSSSATPNLKAGIMPIEKEGRTPPKHWALKLDFMDANPDVRPRGEEKTGAIVSYFKGKPADWKTGLATYSRIVYPYLWPGIDLACSGTFDKLKYEFIVHPGADPSKIRLAYRGAGSLTVDKEGQLEVQTPVGGFHDDTPVAYQEIDGNRVPVRVAYSLDTKAAAQAGTLEYGFDVGEYDQTQSLTLDPAILIYCGYIGGNDVDWGLGIAVDSLGCAYVTGITASTESTFPVNVGGFGPSYNGGAFPGDAFVAKVNATGTALVYCGYIGGSANEAGHAIAVDGSGNAYITGATNSTEASFPVNVGPSTTYGGASGFPGDVFVAKVNSSGTGLDYCGYIGGSDYDTAWGIAVDSTGYAYVTGRTNSTETTFPVETGPYTTYSGATDAFVAKVEADGSALVYCGYIGGTADETGNAIAVDSLGNAYVAGTTDSTAATFPETAGPDLTQNGGNDAFVAKVNAAGNALSFCGFIGGSGNDYGRGIAVDTSRNAYVTGDTVSTQTTFPDSVGPDTSHNGGNDAFVAKVNASGASLAYCGYVGGSGDDYGYGIAVDNWQNAYVTGSTTSSEASFPVSIGPDLTHNGGKDAFIAEVRSDGTGLFYCGYVGGTNDDSGNGIAVGSPGSVYIAGNTTSSEASFPVTVGPDLVFNSGDDAFVTKVTISLNPPTLVTPADLATGRPLNATLNWTDSNTTPQEQGYRVRIREQGGSYTEHTVAQNETSYVTSGLSLDTTYEWNVQAMGNGQDLPDSAWANGGTDWSFTTTDVLPSTTITTSPSGLEITVDSTTYTAPYVFQWTPESSHTINVSSPQSGAAGTRYVFFQWSDAGAQSHSISAPYASTSYTATFDTQYSLATSANPVAGGTVSPSGTTWHNSGAVVDPVQASAAANYIFTSWSGDLTGSTNPTTIAMNAPKNVVANFAEYPTIMVTSSPVGRQITVDSVNYTAPHTFQWLSGSTHSIGVTSPQAGTAGTRYVYSSWSDSGLQTHNVSPTSNTTYTANFTTQHQLTTSASPAEGGAVTPAGTTWQNAGLVQVQANPSMYYSFSNWSGDLSGSTNPTNINMNGPKTVVANFLLFPVYNLTIQSTPDTGVPITVSPNDIDGSGNGNANFTRRYYSGMSVTLTAPATYIGATFVKWTVDLVDDTNQTVQVTMDSHKTAVAVYLNPIQEVGFLVTPGPARNVFVSGSHAYVAAGSSGLRVIDISNPSSPTEVGNVLTGGSAEDVHGSGLLAFVAAGDQGLRIIDVSNPASPVEVGSYDVSNSAYGVTVSGRYAYVADRDLGLKIVDILNPVAPVEVGGLSFSDQALDVFVAGSYAYVSASGAGLRIINVSDPAAPFEAGFFDTSGTATRVHVFGTHAFVADLNGLSVIDISNPSSPSETGYWSAPDSARGVFALGAYAYLADDGSGLRVLDVSNLPTLDEIGHAPTPGPAYGVHIAGSYAYVAAENSGLRVIDLSGRVSPSITVDTPGGMTIWIKKQSGRMEWTSTGSIANVNIYLYKGATQVRTIALNIPDDGAETWTPPGTLVDGGDYSLRIEKAGDPSINGSSFSFQIRAAAVLFPPELQAPASGATGQYTSLNLQWKDNNLNPQEKKYRVRVKQSGGAYVNFDTLANATSYLLTKRNPNKTYYWNVMAVGNGTTTKNSAWANSGVDWSFATGAKVSLTAPGLSAPASGSTGIMGSADLQWTDPNSDPPELGYKIRIKPAGGAYAIINVARNLTSYLRTGLVPNKTYYWNVQAVGDGTGVITSGWANGGVDWSFSTAAPVTLNPPDLQSPADGDTGQPLSVTLGWLDTNSSPQEQGYQVRIKPAGGAYITFNTARDAVSYFKKNLAKNKIYYWNVRAKGTGSVTKDSAWANGGVDWRFTTGS